MVNPEVDILLKAKDMATTAFKKVSKSGSSAGKLISKHWKGASVAMGAAGLALEGLARRVAPLNEQVRTLAKQLDMTQSQMRKLAIATADATRPLEDVFAMFKVGREQGLKTEEQLSKFAIMWDTVGDATKENAVEMARASVALNSMGIDINNQEKAMTALDYVYENATIRTMDFLAFIEKCGPELRSLNFDIDDTAAFIGLLQQELGMSARTARMEFRQAMSASDGTLEGLLEILGTNIEAFKKFRSAVDESSGAIQSSADEHYASKTAMEHLQHALKELTLTHGDLIQALSILTPILFVIPPMIAGIVAASKLYAMANFKLVIPSLISVKASIIAIHIAGGPLLWLIEGLAVAMVLFAVAWAKNWGGIQESTLKALNWIGDALVTAANYWLGTFETWINKTIKVLNMLPGVAIEWEAKFGDIGKNWSLKLGDGFKKGMEMSVGKIQEAFNKVEDVVSGKESKLQGQEIGTELINQMAVGVEENTALIDVISEQVKKIKAPLEEAAAKSSEAWKAGFTGISTGMGSLVELVGGKSKELFALQKGASIATAIMNANEAATKAMAKFPGPLGMALAGVVYGAAMANVAVIAAQEMAKGGIVKKPTLALVGEAGPEAVIPLNKMGRGGDTFNFSITGPFMGTPAEARMWARKLRPYLNDENAR